MALIKEVMKNVMVRGEDYGHAFPGAPRPSLLKPGAEKLCLLFRLDPQYELVSEKEEGRHLSITTRCVLYHIPTGRRLGSGLGSCSTRESQYAYRSAFPPCPKCGKKAIIRRRYGGGWLCFKKKDGCGAVWPAGAPEIESQETGRVPNEDLADQYNTILNMADKRALIAGVRVVTAASAIFAQEFPEDEGPGRRERARSASAGRAGASPQPPEKGPSPQPPSEPSPERQEFFQELQKQDALWIWPHYCKVGDLKNREEEDRQIRDWKKLAVFPDVVRDLVKMAAEKGWSRAPQGGAP
jgi:ribosomal protein L37AE/L43A